MSILKSTHSGKFIPATLKWVKNNFKWNHTMLMTHGDGTQSLVMYYDANYSITWDSNEKGFCFSGHVYISDDRWYKTAYVIRRIQWQYEMKKLYKYFETNDPKLGEYIRDKIEEYKYTIKFSSPFYE